ncbi:C6 transcription factor [Sarocladium implicatum]|nr:C6 transcription factor [Sarocladium implicatum]
MVTTRASTSTDGVDPKTPSKSLTNGSTSSPVSRPWTHSPTNWTLLWLTVSLPLVTWDFIYCLFRPWTMPGGHWHYPIWAPYELYGRIDGIYGSMAFDAGDGFTSAQAFMNVVETAAYAYYLYIYLTTGKSAKGASSKLTGKTIGGSDAGKAALIGFSGALMTLAKTVLYWLNEYYSNYRHIGHNSLRDIIILWILPNGAWLVGATYMTVSIGNDLLRGLAIAAGHSKTA